MNQYVLKARRAALLFGAAAALMIGAACTGDEEPENGASNGETSASANAPAASSSGPAVDASGKITILAKDNVFDPKSFSGKANTKVTLTMENKGSAVHDFRIKDRKGPDGQEYQTALVPGGQSATLEFTLPAGTYDFYCFVHPVEMRGKITMQ